MKKIIIIVEHPIWPVINILKRIPMHMKDSKKNENCPIQKPAINPLRISNVCLIGLCRIDWIM